jgi:hypothetical protein
MSKTKWQIASKSHIEKVIPEITYTSLNVGRQLTFSQSNVFENFAFADEKTFSVDGHAAPKAQGGLRENIVTYGHHGQGEVKHIARSLDKIRKLKTLILLNDWNIHIHQQQFSISASKQTEEVAEQVIKSPATRIQ